MSRKFLQKKNFKLRHGFLKKNVEKKILKRADFGGKKILKSAYQKTKRRSG